LSLFFPIFTFQTSAIPKTIGKLLKLQDKLQFSRKTNVMQKPVISSSQHSDMFQISSHSVFEGF